MSAKDILCLHHNDWRLQQRTLLAANENNPLWRWMLQMQIHRIDLEMERLRDRWNTEVHVSASWAALRHANAVLDEHVKPAHVVIAAMLLAAE
jgi:hypothetical protein